MSKHTPGPWLHFDDCIHSGSQLSGDGDIVCLSPEVEGYEDSAKRWEANARLISAAPELLDAAKRLTEAADAIASGADDGTPYLIQFGEADHALRAAIAKATGADNA